MSEMRERLRDAVRDECGSLLCAWIDMGTKRCCAVNVPPHKCRCDAIALATLDAMRDPTREMLEGLIRHRGYDPHADEASLDRLGQMDIATMQVFVLAYRAMVNAAVPPHERSEDETNASTTKG